MPALPARIVPRLRQLILMLSSDHDGEVTNAARAIGRLLAKVGLTYHEFAGAIGTSAKSVQGQCPPEAWEDYEPEPELEPPTAGTLGRPQQLAWMKLALQLLQLDGDDKAMVSDIVGKLSLFRSYCLNREQTKVFNRIVARAWRVGRRA